MLVVLVLTLVFGFALAAVSYALVESPCREALRRWEHGAERPVPPLDSSITHQAASRAASSRPHGEERASEAERRRAGANRGGHRSVRCASIWRLTRIRPCGRRSGAGYRRASW